MDSFTPNHLPAIILTLLGVSVLLFGGWAVYTAAPDSPKYHYSVNEHDEPLSDSDSEVIQFADLSGTGQEVFLEALDQREYNTNKEATEINIGTDYTARHYVEYQNNIYAFSAETIPSGWWGIGGVISVGVAIVGLITILLGAWFVRENHFKLPTAALSGVLTIGLIRLVMIFELIEKPHKGYGPELVLPIPLVPVLVWVLLWDMERKGKLSFSQ